MFLHRKDIEKINDILEKFPDLTTFKIEQEVSSGIGSCTYITFEQEIKGHSGSFTVEISGVDNW